MAIKTNMKSKNRDKLSNALLRLMVKFSEIDGRTRYYGTDQPLHEAEIHMIKVIKENEGIHATGLADILGVTKGAVSQLLQKLERKGMIIKDVDSSNLSRLVLKLTPTGQTAYRYHEELHRDYDEIFNAALGNASEHERRFLKDFFISLEKELDTCEENNLLKQR